MDKGLSKVLRFAIVPLIILFYYVIVITVVIPLWRWGIQKQPGAIDMNVLSVVGAAASLFSIILAIGSQVFSIFSGKRLETTLMKNNDLTERIFHNQNSITKGLVETVGKLAQRSNSGETAMQQPGNGWAPDGTD